MFISDANIHDILYKNNKKLRNICRFFIIVKIKFILMAKNLHLPFNNYTIK